MENNETSLLCMGEIAKNHNKIQYNRIRKEENCLEKSRGWSQKLQKNTKKNPKAFWK